MNFPENLEIRSVIDEFMLGENILMAPVFGDNLTTRAVVLPGPTTWTHMWTG